MTEVELAGRISLHSSRTRQVYLLDRQASDLWRLLDGTRSRNEVLAALAHQYGVPVAVVERDVLALLEDFQRDGLLPT